MSLSEKIYLMAFMICLVLVAKATGIEFVVSVIFTLLTGYNFLLSPTLRAVDPPLALPSADDNQKSTGN